MDNEGLKKRKFFKNDHYWKFKEGLRENVLAKMNEEEEEETDPYADLYTDISDRIWRHGEDLDAPKGAFSIII